MTESDKTDRGRFGRWLTVAALAGACLGMSLAAASTEAAFRGAPGKIAYSRAEVGPPFGDRGIFATTFNGLGLFFLLEDSGTGASFPAYSADGKMITFHWDDIAGGGTDNEIWVMNEDGSAPRQVTHNAFDDRFPVFTADGTRVVYQSPRMEGQFLDNEIFAVNLASGIEVPLTSNNVQDINPASAADGRIFFVSQPEPGTGPIDFYVMSDDGSGRTRVSVGTPGLFPDVSPDGLKLIYEFSGGTDSEIYSRDLITGVVTQLTNNSVDERAPGFAPSGRWIVFSRDTNADGGGDEIFRINPDGSSEVNLSRTPLGPTDRVEGAPDWQAVQVKCGKKTATIVGTSGRDVITGTPSADAIAGLGGRDRIRGLGGKDVLCGGKKNDQLFGGGGRDLLIAGKGRDDRCKGGKGSDAGKSCEDEKGA